MRGELHHIELWVPDLSRAIDSFGWLFMALGYVPYQEWSEGRSWRLGDGYIVVEQSPALTEGVHDRCRPGLNHLALDVGDRSQLDELLNEASEHGWTLMFPDRHPYAGGPEHCAGYIENSELVASQPA
jgi:catechol 2,3-dioxygenase-like lactoylglutathione lyase family enzyme